MPTAIPQWSSPARWLVPRVAAAPSRAAHERASALDPMIAVLSLCCPDVGRFECSYDRNRQILTVSRKAIEVLWVASYAYRLLYMRMYERSAQEPSVVDLYAEPDISAATDLLLWAHNDLVMRHDTPWPPNLPRPSEHEVEGTRESYAADMFDAVVGFVLHHELAHHRAGHESSDYETERDADYEAARWLLEGLEETSAAFQVRAHAIAILLGTFSACSIHLESFSSASHPRAFDRLYDTLSRYIEDRDHPAWRMAVVILHWHMTASSIDVPVGTHRDARACVDAYIEALAAFEARIPRRKNQRTRTR